MSGQLTPYYEFTKCCLRTQIPVRMRNYDDHP